ncbi:MAG: hypothetical protein H0W64_10970 [Gammaproteobacteria bacterium]|nr:hypothetical protein [Gammaproteobacteria bacterium]
MDSRDPKRGIFKSTNLENVQKIMSEANALEKPTKAAWLLRDSTTLLGSYTATFYNSKDKILNHIRLAIITEDAPSEVNNNTSNRRWVNFNNNPQTYKNSLYKGKLSPKDWETLLNFLYTAYHLDPANMLTPNDSEKSLIQDYYPINDSDFYAQNNRSPENNPRG